ncbi:LysR family transcriptional regulator [Saccharopolyspora rhizosphaerae]|uniref:LysR family transcriptional regulator n=1 Tax=Saccharopolyspora rhizosphaerae TaxID=2492662 RepID=A0A426JN67_9PSEU|nr:LysR family transcriptional regulator [Saccharopolyspora rhizosphaerae]RRO14703.1 LysR family transcriptional regulator [Saccharopolyspora rhizosphaerae]
MEVRRLRYLVRLAEHRSFTRAAASLHIAQPALSQQIRLLERELGAELVERRPTGVTLTAVGEVAVTEAQQVLDRIDRAERAIRNAATGQAGRLRVAYTRSAPGGVAAELVDRFRRHHPDVDLALTTGWTARNLHELRTGSLDAAFVRTPLELHDLRCVPLTTEELLLAVPSGHALGPVRTVRRDQIEGEPVVLWPRENAPGMYDRIVHQLWPGSSPRVVREEPDDEQLLRAVAGGAGIAPVPGPRARSLRTRGVRLKHLAAPRPTVDLALAYHPDTTPALDHFLELCAQIAGLRG